MAIRLRRVRRIIGSGFLVAAGISPFVVYAGLKIADKDPAPPWPSGVALATASGGELSSFSLLHFGSREPTILRFPAETELKAPGTGTLRAASMYRIGGASLMGRALADTIGLRVPFFAEWAATFERPGAPPTRSNLGTHRDEVMRLLSRATARVVPAPGEFRDRFGVRYYTLNLDVLRLVLAGKPLPPTPPTPATRSPSPAAINAATSVEVLNQGGERGSAADVAQALQQAGFVDVRTGNGAGRAVNGLVIYYATQRADGEAVAVALGQPRSAAAPLPQSLDTTADVLVLVGRNAFPSPASS